jgi:hypothetical protein
MDVSPGKLALGGVGLVFVWSAFHGASLGGTIKDLITGVQPTGGANPITGASGGGFAGGGSATGDQIAQTALQYEGDNYVWGGASFPSPGGDCSGLVNDVWIRDLGMAGPGTAGGSLRGHGPVTGQWFIWNGCETVPRGDMQAGDLVCWLSHMGIAISNQRMISALNPGLGVKITPVDGIGGAAPPGEPLRIRRMKQELTSGNPKSPVKRRVKI